MATGASSAELAVILIDARKGVLTQTRRHSFIVSLLGIRHVILAVNKMDLVDWDSGTFEAISGAYREFAHDLDIHDVTCIPVSALTGDNVFDASPNMPWYQGPTLLDVLETVDVSTDVAERAFRMPVQWVNRPNLDFRGFSGTIASGTVRPGDRIMACPSERTSTISRIVTLDGDLDVAIAGQSITLVLDDEIDVSRGDILADAEQAPDSTDQFAGHLIWMHDEPFAARAPVSHEDRHQDDDGSDHRSAP